MTQSRERKNEELLAFAVFEMLRDSEHVNRDMLMSLKLNDERIALAAEVDGDGDDYVLRVTMKGREPKVTGWACYHCGWAWLVPTMKPEAQEQHLLAKSVTDCQGKIEPVLRLHAYSPQA